MLFQMRIRLSVMMFFEYFIWGVWYVTLGTWLGQQLHFSGKEIGLAAGTTALGAMLSPFLVGLMADEWFATQRLLAALHGIGGVLLWVASTQTTFGPMYFILLIYSLCYMPTMALTNSLSFRQMKDPKQDFGAIRVLGTAGSRSSPGTGPMSRRSSVAPTCRCTPPNDRTPGTPFIRPRLTTTLPIAWTCSGSCAPPSSKNK